MHLAKAKGWKPQLLDCRNSGDTAGDKGRVVGYASIAFSAQAQPAKAASSAESVTADEQKLLLELARKTVKQVASRGALPDVDSSKLSSRLKEPKGCFVTLTKRGALRGCIGHIFPKEPLYKAVIENAQSAAINDYRFPPVTADEVDKLALEVSVLTEPKPLSFTSPEDLLAKLQPHKDGVVLQIGMQRATYLPQVWEQISDKVSFLNSLSQKAGCPANAWRSPGVSVLIYHAQAFHETRK
jgi:AmmeMemoRadiSam system protein A